MPDGFKVEVPITVKGGREGEKVGKQIGEKIAEQLKRAFRGVGIGRPSTGGMGIGTEVAATTSMGKSLKGIAGKVGIIALAVSAGVGILSKFSPYLKGVLSIFGRAFALFFRPFGDFLATLLRPLAILLMKVAVAFLRWTRGPAGKAVVGGLTGAGIGAGIGAAVGSIIPGAGTAVGAAVGGIVGGVVGLIEALFPGTLAKLKEFNLAGWLKEKITEGIENIKEFPGWLWGKLQEIWDWIWNFPEWMWSNLKDVWNYVEDFGGWLWGNLKTIWNWNADFPSWVWENITSIWSWPFDFPSWIWGRITSIWGWTYNFAQWLYSEITSAFSNIKSWLSGVGVYLYNRITESIREAFSGFTFGWSWWWQKLPFFQQGGVMPHTGLAYLHKGEEVVPTAKVGESKSVIFRPTFEINAGIARDIDVDAIVRRAGRLTEMELKKRGII